MIKSLVRLLFFAVAGVLLATATGAQMPGQRTLPAQGKRGELTGPLALPLVQIDGKPMRLAPGAVLYDQNNRSMLHAALPAQADVFYTTDRTGEIQRLYILTPAEQAMLDRRPGR